MHSLRLACAVREHCPPPSAVPIGQSAVPADVTTLPSVNNLGGQEATRWAPCLKYWAFSSVEQVNGCYMGSLSRRIRQQPCVLLCEGLMD